MSHDATNEETGKLDLVPMIDCVMLLLLFFILTSSFKSEEQRISALLPSQGQCIIPTKVPVDQKEIVNIAILPGEGRAARVRIGGEEFPIDGAALASPSGPEVEAAIDALHAAVARRLATYETEAPREKQTPVEIHCATRLPWRFAIAVYDAVRAYEQSRLPDPTVALVDQRSVAFGAPAIRNSAGDNPHDELERLEHLR